MGARRDVEKMARLAVGVVNKDNGGEQRRGAAQSRSNLLRWRLKAEQNAPA